MKISWATHTDITEGTFKEFCKSFYSQEVPNLISNAETEIRILNINNNLFLPVTINNTEWNSSYVCSPYTAYILYARDELKKINSSIIRFALNIVLSLLSRWLKSASINKNIHVNNFLLSTNPYPAWKGEYIEHLSEFIKKEFPAHAIIFRSLNEFQHASLLSKFESNNYNLIASRQIYIIDEVFDTWKLHNNNYQDRRIIKKSSLIYVPHEEMNAYLEEALSLYNLLYLRKYSIHNPAFTLKYFQESYKLGWIHFQGYKNKEGKLKAFSGLFIIDNTITSPLVGYDTKADKKEALYIHAIETIFRYKFKTGKILNFSSGASHFKRLRGGKAFIEYSAIYIRHLSMYRRLTIKALMFFSNKIGVPLLKKYEL